MTEPTKDMLVSTYDQIVKEYVQHEFDSPAMERHYLRFCQSLPQGGRVLDAGCGPGQAARRFCERGFKVTGIDLSDKMLEYARSAAPQASFLRMDVEDITLTETFDGVWAAFILVHIRRQNQQRVLGRFRDLLSPHGILYLGMLEGEGEKVVPEPYNRSLKQYFVFNSRAEIEMSLDQAGFEVEQYTSQSYDEEGERFTLSSTFARRK